MLRGRERFAEAAEIYSSAVALIPEPGRADWSLFYFRGIAYERTKEWAKAEADFKKALQDTLDDGGAQAKKPEPRPEPRRPDNGVPAAAIPVPPK